MWRGCNENDPNSPRFRESNDGHQASQFQPPGLYELFDYLIEVDENMEFDPIGICCDFAEYDNLEAYQNDYGEDCEPDDYIVCAEYDEDQFIVWAH